MQWSWVVLGILAVFLLFGCLQSDAPVDLPQASGEPLDIGSPSTGNESPPPLPGTSGLLIFPIESEGD